MQRTFYVVFHEPGPTIGERPEALLFTDPEIAKMFVAVSRGTGLSVVFARCEVLYQNTEEADGRSA